MLNVIQTAIQDKWQNDSIHLPLKSEVKELYFHIHYRHFQILGHFPNLIAPSDFNSKIHWLKLFDQSVLHPDLCDKILIKDYVESKIGPGHTPRTLKIFDSIESICVKDAPEKFVLKTNNDSGTVFLFPNKDGFNLSKIEKRLRHSIDGAYGWSKGEWPYSYVKPKIFIEELLEFENDTPAPDYKFHCANGEIKWIQYIERWGIKREISVDETGKRMNFHLDHNHVSIDNFSLPQNWEEMKNIVKKLADGWKYLRIDMYEHNSKPFVGELTFYPRAGTYHGEGQKIAGQLLDFSTNDFKPFVIDQLESKVSRNSLYRRFY